MSNCILNLFNESGVTVDENSLKICAETVADHERPLVQCRVSLLLCQDADMKKYNQIYRGHGSITDVLCFAPQEIATININGAQAEINCDIIIDINQIDRQKGHRTIDEELMDVFIHGLLHGFGYDHIRPNDQLAMKDKEIYYKHKMDGT